MSKFQIAKGLLENLPNNYTEGKVYFIYDNVNSENLNIYADIDGIRRKIGDYQPKMNAITNAQINSLFTVPM